MRVIARRDPALSARVMTASPLRYTAGADSSLDRPAHVRSGSGLAWVGSRLLVLQDDANFVALVDPTSMHVRAVTLPAGAAGRRQFDASLGNKAHKLDLEALATIPRPDGEPVVLALGSGSTSRRQTLVSLRALHESDGLADDGIIAVHPVPAFYERLRDSVDFAGSELNVEAAVYLAGSDGARLRLFNRGNGATRDRVAPVNATCDVSWSELAAHLSRPSAVAPPGPTNIVQYDLGALDALPLTFTGAAVVAALTGVARACTVFTAAAEASPDSTRDGPVAGCSIGAIHESAGEIRARWTLLRDAAGQPFPGKVEGIALQPDDAMRCYVVVDRDAPEVPSEICEVLLEGPWFTMG